MRMNYLSLILLLALPLTALAQPQKIQITPLAKNVYVHISFNEYKGSIVPSNGLLIINQSSVLLVDTPWGEDQTRQLIQWVDKEIHLPITHLITTHSHADRVSGIPALKEKGIHVLSYALTSEKIKKLGYAPPDLVLPADTLFSIDGTTIQTYYPGKGHTDDNIIVYLPDSKVLFGGCFIRSTEVTDMGNIADADLKAWPASIKKLQKKFTRPGTIVPGHQGWSQLNSPDHTLKLLQEREAKGN